MDLVFIAEGGQAELTEAIGSPRRSDRGLQLNRTGQRLNRSEKKVVLKLSGTPRNRTSEEMTHAATLESLEGTIVAPLIGILGVVASIAFTTMGAAYGTARTMLGIVEIAPRRPNLIMKSVVHVVMAGVLAIYGLVIAIIIAGRIDRPPNYTLFSAFAHLGAGLTMGLTGLAGGCCIGVLGDSCTRSTGLRPQMYMTAVLLTGFAMVLGMYGLICALLLATK